ncbi:ABC transporter ATP-binding protein [Sedimentibacter sp. zth1]|uniref:ABC transporter ATP-binding protein n=1 Tax=Sedimentibacter sp. zth1 TaxID=2816908 RepID=UPI001A91A8BD|nr:ABC transporter ATP-binding protein [Sedimentibacter sp. zth1]QSX04872.1 ABC transporter ATP-binding protein [Sedimentibacter sp. zth1]
MKKLFKNFNLPILTRSIALMGNRKNIFVAFILGFCAVELCCTVLYTIGIKGVINAITEMNLKAFWVPMSFIIANHLLWWTYAPISSYVTGKISKGTMRNFKSDFCEHIVRLPMRYHDNKPTSELLSVLLNDTACLSKVYDWSLFQVLRSATGGIGGIVLMAAIDWRFAIVVFSLGTISMLISSHFSKKLEAIGKEQQERLAKTSTDAYELIRAAKTIRLFHLEANRQTEFANIDHNEAAIKTKGGKINAKMNSAISLFNTLSYVTVLFIGAIFVHYGLSDWGTVIALLKLKGTSDMLFVECGQFMAGMQTNVAGIKRVFEIADTEEESEIYSKSCDIPILKMSNIDFDYEDGFHVLQKFNLCLERNTFTVLAGESGSGKSTVMKLILGLYAPNSGTIFTQNADNLRSLTAYVPQEPTLFRGTVYDNIAFGNSNASEDEIISVAKMAGADEFIRKLGNGYQTILFDNGANLSGGQKQRIAIARALIKGASILLLDEITSALDKDMEVAVINTIKNISKYKTVLFITHNPEIVKDSAHIVTINP